MARRIAESLKKGKMAVTKGIAFLIKSFFLDVEGFIAALQDWLLGTAGGGTGLGQDIHIAIIAALASKKGKMAQASLARAQL